MKKAIKANKITITTNHWTVPSVESAFDGRIEGIPSEEEKRQRIEEVLEKRAAWKPSKEGMKLVEQLKVFTGFRVQIQLWDPIMYILEDEGPFPLEADCKDVVVLQDSEFLQAYVVVDNIKEIPTPGGYSPHYHLVSRDNTHDLLIPLSKIYEIGRV